jgi:gamma-glutamylcyclotransferase (GGCT)/AIG2-like uncharacterized protein YtfP
MFYFAYGSNLNKAQMLHRCPRAEPLGKVILPKARLIFRGVADVEVDEGSSVQGGVWRITRHCEQALDRYEGVRHGLYRKEYIRIRVKEGRKTVVGDALVYVMNRTHYAMPSRSYFQTIRDGYDDFGLDHASLDTALRATADELDECAYEYEYEGEQIEEIDD